MTMEKPVETTLAAKPQCCWFPFRKEYYRRRHQQIQLTRTIDSEEYVPPPDVYYFKRRGNDGRYEDCEVALYEYGWENASQQPGGTELILEGHPMPSLVTIKKKEKSRKLKRSGSEVPCDLDALHLALAEIETNCMTKDFWVDEIQESGPFACFEDHPSKSNYQTKFRYRKDSGGGTAPNVFLALQNDIAGDDNSIINRDNSIVDIPQDRRLMSTTLRLFFPRLA